MGTTKILIVEDEPNMVAGLRDNFEFEGFQVTTALDGVDFELRKGEILAVVGDNGAGKSSLIKALTGALKPDSCEILLDGHNINRVPAAGRVKLGMGRTFQITEIFPELSVRENAHIAVETGLGFSLRGWLNGTNVAMSSWPP